VARSLASTMNRLPIGVSLSSATSGPAVRTWTPSSVDMVEVGSVRAIEFGSSRHPIFLVDGVDFLSMAWITNNIAMARQVETARTVYRLGPRKPMTLAAGY
jgi:hypothetical protein